MQRVAITLANSAKVLARNSVKAVGQRAISSIPLRVIDSKKETTLTNPMLTPVILEASVVKATVTPSDKQVLPSVSKKDQNPNKAPSIWTRLFSSGPTKKSHSQNHKQIPTTLAVGTGIGFGIWIGAQFIDRFADERSVSERAKEVTSELNKLGYTVLGWHGIKLETVEASKENPIPTKDKKGNIFYSPPLKAGAWTGKEGILYPVVHRTSESIIKASVFAEQTTIQITGKRKTDALTPDIRETDALIPDIKETSTGDMITKEGQERGRVYTLVPSNQRELGLEGNFGILWKPSPSRIVDAWDRI